MTMPITNAKDRPLNQNSGTMPDVSGAILEWLQPMTFTLLAKSVVAFKNKESTPIPIQTQGLWQPYQPRNLQQTQEGQRSWRWFRMFTLPGSGLDVDNIISYLGQNYRVMSINDWTLAGYVEYKLVQDYQ